jgi:signal transduction histidine kinase/class 3 adenylate cyclase
MVPVRVHGLPASMVRDRACIVNGDEYCEWEVTWTPKPKEGVWWLPWGTLSGIGVFAFLVLTQPALPLSMAFSAGIVATIISSLGASRLRREARSREAVIHEQVQFVEARHEELREAYLEQERTQVELRRKVSQLTTLHSAGLFFGSTLDRETLLQTVLQTLIHQLHYDRAMISRFDQERQVSYDSRVLGGGEDIAAYARSHEVSVTDPNSFEGTVLLQGKPMLIGDIREVWDRLDLRNQQLASMTNARSVIAVPLKVKDRILGSLTVDRTREHSLTEDDRALMETMANQVAIALDNVEAYHQIEALNVGLEAKVRERTTELERLNHELTTVNDQLQELDRLKSEFFANVSHEFRTPLTLSLGAFRTLSKVAPTSDAKKLTEAGLRNTSRLLFLINELLDLAKFNSGLMELKKQCLDFAALVRTVAANFESGERRRIHFRGLNSPAPLEADPNQMKKVLYNLLSNAFKFSDPEKGQVWIRLNAENNRVELEVEDNGIGIPHDQLKRIFNRFTQVEGSATRRYEGTGIGLALVKEIVTAHQGEITVESELGRGSTFTIVLPRGVASSDSIASIGEDDSLIIPIPDGAPSGNANLATNSPDTNDDRPLLLVADDNADMRAYLGRLLQAQYRVVLAKDGVEGLEQAKTFHPDLIITDVMMPRMSGYEFLKAVREDSALRSTPVVMLTARAGTEARLESWETGADDYIAKPFDESEIQARVNNLIRARAQERELRQLQKEKIARFLPRNLADMILSGEHEEFLRGHRREISVVFIDLRGFTAFVEKSDPEDVMTILREYQTAMGHLVFEYGGTLERFIGDAVMVYFNDPLPCPNHAQQAVKMAIAMRQTIYGLQEEWKKRGAQLGAGIGIATGYATIGAVGFQDRLDYAAIGPVTNLAARLCSEAQHGQILVSDRVVPLVKDLIAEFIGELTLKGIQYPVPVSQVLGMRP